MKKNAGNLKMSLKQARKLVVLERLCEGRKSNREAGLNRPGFSEGSFI
jgi:hypothetical protein